MQTRSVPVRGGLFSIETLEGGDGPHLLYLHGEQGVDEGAFLDALAGRFHVLAPRHPGFGASSGEEQIGDLQDALYFYLDYLDALAIGETFIAGHGLGGMVAIELAAMQPKRFPRVALIAPFGLWMDACPVPDFFVFSPDELRRANFYDAAGLASEALALPSGPDDIDRILERAKSQRVAAKFLWPIPNRGLARRIHRVTQPVLLLWGEADGICPPAYADAFRSRLADARVTIVPKAGHLPQLEQPEATTDAIVGFLGTV